MQNLKVENFGKIKEADIEIGDFTVLAGSNNTGKSFISKLLYSLLNPMNADLKHDGLRRVINLLKSYARYFPFAERYSAVMINKQISEMETIIANYNENEDRSFGEIISELRQIVTEIQRVLGRVMRVVNVENRNRRARPEMVALAELSKALDDVMEEFGEGMDEWRYTQAELTHRIERNLIGNFQIANISGLKGRPNEDSKIDLDNLLQVTISDNKFDVEINQSSFATLDKITNVVYFESPIYWKLFTALREIGASRRFQRRIQRDTLTGVPEYFYDIAGSLIFEYSGEMAYPEVYQSLVGNDVINGYISISERGEMMFQENGRSYPLQMTATGVANIGFLAALIQRKVIDRGTMLFIDEPEAHLHPSWQVVVAEALFNLAKGGVKIVIATHSLDILKWLEVHIQKYPDDEQIVALNRFPNPVKMEDDFKMKMARIKKELSKPFTDLYLEGL